MKTGRLRRLAAAIFCLGATAACEPGAQADDLPIGAGFDFYVLSLSWSPSFCAAEGDEANPRQCGGERSYGFIVHGLWPQFERGYPENCRTTGPLDVPRTRIAKLSDIMPSAAVVRHQWRKHGTCAGLNQHDYFSVLRTARERVVVPDLTKFTGDIDPDQLESAFLEANPDLPADGVALTCDRRFLREVRICLTKELGFRACEEVDRRSCRSDRVLMPAAR